MDTAIIFGVTGQDGYYLSKLLLDKGFYVIGVKRRSSIDNTYRIGLLHNKNLKIIEGDVSDPHSVFDVINTEFLKLELSAGSHKLYIFNLAAQSHVHTSFNQPSYTFNVNTLGVLNILECIRKMLPNRTKVAFYQASTSEMFGSNVSHTAGMHEYTTDIQEIKDRKYVGIELEDCYQSEITSFAPMSPYAVSKVAAHNLVVNYRKAYGIHASCGILFNHESYLRGENFVTRKITEFLRDLELAYHVGCEEDLPRLQLGNLDSYRDFGYAGDYVKAMYLMLEQSKPDDYVIATGKTCKISQFLDLAIEVSELDKKFVLDHIDFSESLKRPSEVDYLRGNANKARKVLGWEAEVDLKELIRKMLYGEI